MKPRKSKKRKSIVPPSKVIVTSTEIGIVLIGKDVPKEKIPLGIQGGRVMILGETETFLVDRENIIESGELKPPKKPEEQALEDLIAADLRESWIVWSKEHRSILRNCISSWTRRWIQESVTEETPKMASAEGPLIQLPDGSFTQKGLMQVIRETLEKHRQNLQVKELFKDQRDAYRLCEVEDILDVSRQWVWRERTKKHGLLKIAPNKPIVMISKASVIDFILHYERTYPVHIRLRDPAKVQRLGVPRSSDSN